MSSESTKRVKGFKNLFLESKYLDTTIKRNLKERKTQLAKYDKVLCAASYLKNGTKYHCNQPHDTKIESNRWQCTFKKYLLKIIVINHS